MADDVDISSMPAPPADLVQAPADISNMPAPPEDIVQSYDGQPIPKSGKIPKGYYAVTGDDGQQTLRHEAGLGDTMRALGDLPGVGMAESIIQGGARLAGKAASGITNLFAGQEAADKVRGAVDTATELPPSNDPLIQAQNAVQNNVIAPIAKPIDEAVGNLPAGPRTAIEATEEALPDIAQLIGLKAGLGAKAAETAEAAPRRATPVPDTAAPLTGDDLRAQPDPLASKPSTAPAAAAEAPQPSAAAGPVPGKPHYTLKPDVNPAPAPAPAEPPRFAAPSEEGAKAGASERAEQNTRTDTIHRLNDLAGGQLGEVRTSAISGDTAEAGTDYQHSQIRDTGGDRMQSVIANETNTLRQAASNMVEKTGTVAEGVDQPALRQRGQVISDAIGKIEDWFDKGVNNLYETAKTRAQGIPITDMPSLRGLTSDESQFAGTTEGEALYRGVQARAKKLGLIGDDGAFKPATVEQAEQFRQYLGEQWTPRTAGLITKLKDALDDDVARHGGADLFTKARQLRAQKGKLLEDPTGIAKLRAPDDRLGINRQVPIEQVPDYVANLPTDQFHHIINVLKSSAHLGEGELAGDAAAAIREIKGHMAAKVHDAGSSKIQGGWDAKSTYKQLNAYANKMPSVFSPKEMGDWKTINDGGNVLRMDRRYPGAAAQTHNVGFLGETRQIAGGVARGTLDTAAHAVAGPFGPVITEATGLGKLVGRVVGGDAEKAAAAKRASAIEERITSLNGKPTKGGTASPGAKQRGGPKAEAQPVKGSPQEKFMADFNNSTRSSPYEPTHRKVNAGTGAEVVRDPTDPNTVHLQSLRSTQTGAGSGDAAMRRLTAMADRHGTAITLDATPLDKAGISQAKLQKFYESHGFKATGEENGMRRDPVVIKSTKESNPYNSTPATKKPSTGAGDPYNNAPIAKDPWGSERVKSDRTPGDALFGGRQRGGPKFTPKEAPLKDAPETDKPFATARKAAAAYAKSAGIEHEPLQEYRYIPQETAQKVADAYDKMKHDPSDPKVKASYDAFKQETKAQWDQIKKTGLKVDFNQPYPYGANPREVTEDVRNNNHMTVFPSESGFGTEGTTGAGAKHPMMENSGVKFDGREVTYNDLFRIVHDYFGHVQEGNGFRGQGEYNAWRNHRTLYSKQAQGAMDAETLGQNAWVNNGPHSKGNEGASQANTVYADQKAGLLPPGVVKEATEGVPKAEHEVRGNLTPDERNQLRADTTKKLMDAFHKDLPPTEEFAAAALAGKAKKGWYANSSKAIANVFGPDAPRFSSLLAAMSPQTSVQMNFHNALRTFINWDKAGRPQSPAAIKSIMEESSLKSPKSNEGGSNVLNAWVPNSIRALTSDVPEKETMSGPKVNSFARNLQDNVNEVTNDAWMSAFSKIDPKKLQGGLNKSGPGKSPMYLAMNAKVRAAAKTLSAMTGESWTPREVQETVWSWAKTAYEHAEEFGDLATIPELVKHKEITDDLIKSTPDFHQLFGTPEHSGFIGNSRYAQDVARLAESKVEGSSATGASEKSKAAEEALGHHLLSAAERLEKLRKERKE